MKKASLADIPSSVYRLQIHEQFSLKKAMEVLPYLNDLGVDGIYCSPVFACASDHGYDVTDPNQLNPRIGSREEFEEFSSLLKRFGMKLLFDIVPNHMSIKEGKNGWWLDVMANGIASSHAGYFDIHWLSEKPGLRGKVLLPVLQDPYGHVLENGKIQLVWNGGFWIRYADYRLPIALSTYSQIFEGQVAKLPPVAIDEEKEWLEFLSTVSVLKNSGCNMDQKDDFARRRVLQLARLCELYQGSKIVRLRLEQVLALLNGKKGNPVSFNELDKLLEGQYYRLAHCLLAEKEINYRRFFNINDLIALHIEKEPVLQAHHHWVFELLHAGKIQGLRVDHIDGLYDPVQYFERIQEKRPSLIVVEKILTYKEKLPDGWKIDGTVGYEFLNILCGLFVQTRNEKAFTKIYEKFTGSSTDFESKLYERRKRYISLFMTSEISFLSEQLEQLAELNRYYRDFTRFDLIGAIQEIIACFPVYRTYIKPGVEIRQADREYIELAVNKAKNKTPQIDASIYQYLHDVLLFARPFSEEERPLAADFIMRFQQLTGSVMAKGLEDSTFYIYNRLISLNEVGGSPQYFGYKQTEFHEFNKEKISQWPLGLLATSTHDTKMSEDVRLRLHVLSEKPQEWRALVLEWKKYNRKYKKLIDGSFFPDPNTEYYIYQMLIGIWEEGISSQFDERLWPDILKALREAGIYTCWRIPNKNYEAAAKDFLLALITPGPENFFYPSFIAFQQKIARYGFWNALSALVLKMGSCGIVDTYQGQEWWDFCLVDPDNRREVNYEIRKASLKTLAWTERLFAGLGGEMKQWITHQALQLRRSHKELFLHGEYLPLKTQNDHVIAFIRKHKEELVIVLAARFLTSLVFDEQSAPLGEACWGAAELLLPKEVQVATASEGLRNIFTGKTVQLQKRGQHMALPLAHVFCDLPCAILTQIE